MTWPVDEVCELIAEARIDARRIIGLVDIPAPAPDAITRIRGALATRFQALDQPSDALDAEQKRSRGYRLEELLTVLWAIEGLRPSPSYRGRGEQVDGLFKLGGVFALCEAKWHADQLPASTIYSFLGKVGGKLAGTLGVFVSMGGFSEDTSYALSLGKAMRVILVDGDDVRAVFDASEGLTWHGLMEIKLRRAAQYGQIYYTWNSHKDMRDA